MAKIILSESQFKKFVAYKKSLIESTINDSYKLLTEKEFGYFILRVYASEKEGLFKFHYIPKNINLNFAKENDGDFYTFNPYTEKWDNEIIYTRVKSSPDAVNFLKAFEMRIRNEKLKAS